MASKQPSEPKRRSTCWFRHHAEATLLATFVRSFAAESYQRKGEFDAVVKALLALAVAPDRLRMLLDSQPGMMAGHALCSTAAALLDRLAASPNMSTAYGAWLGIRRTIERPAHPTPRLPAASSRHSPAASLTRRRQPPIPTPPITVVPGSLLGLCTPLSTGSLLAVEEDQVEDVVFSSASGLTVDLPLLLGTMGTPSARWRRGSTDADWNSLLEDRPPDPVISATLDGLQAGRLISEDAPEAYFRLAAFQQTRRRTLPPPLTHLLRHTWFNALPTLTRTAASRGVLVRQQRPLTTLEEVRLMGGVDGHPLTKAICSPHTHTRLAARAVGQGIHPASLGAVLDLTFARAKLDPTRCRLSVGTVCSGAGFGLFCLDSICGQAGWDYNFNVENDSAMQSLHAAGWANKEPRWVSEATAPKPRDLAHVEVLILSPDCGSFSTANRRFPAGVPEALSAIERMLCGYVRGRNPRVVVFETSGSLARYDRREALLLIWRMLHAAGEYLQWRGILLCPRKDLNWHCTRKRLFLVGYRGPGYTTTAR
jgi:hypothetical protein